MKAAFAILVCCLIALLSESRADIETEPLYIQKDRICREKLFNGRRIEDIAPEELEKIRCSFITCSLKNSGDLGADDDVFSEELFLKYVADYVKEGAPKLINDCKVKASGDSCKFVNCVAKIEIQLEKEYKELRNIKEH